MTWADTKKNIAAKFCRTVLVLDDQILEHTDGSTNSLDHAEQFLKAKEQFAKKGILCDLRHIDKTADASGEAMRTCLSHADVVVVDWYLGVGSGNDPRESIAVLDEILKMGGERFVAIHSQETADNIRNVLITKFELAASVAEFRGESEDSDVIPLRESESAPAKATQKRPPEILTLSPKEPNALRKSKIHLCILHKRTPSETAEELPNAILAALEKAFPDHLHWVGLEFASRVRDMLPELVRGLPSEMDVALVFQALVQAPNELADDLAECLCLELREMLRFDHLRSATDDVVIGRFMEGIAAHPISEFKGNPGKWIPELLDPALTTLPKDWVRTHKVLDNNARSNFCSLLETVLKAPCGISDKAHSRYAALREHLHSVSSEKIKLYPGVVLTADESLTSESTDAKWMLCLTPACDCARDKEHDHLFVFGYETKDRERTVSRGVCTSIHSGEHAVELKWMVSSFHTRKCVSEGPVGWKPVTILRDPFVQKIVQSLWGQQSRIGVNTSEVQRIIRNDKE
jgi:hypothetical protein